MISSDWINALDCAARYYREALQHVVEECGNDRPRIEHIREAAERGLRAADAEMAKVEASASTRS